MRPVTEQMIEFSIVIVGEKYSEELSDPDTVKRQLLSEQFVSQVTYLFLFTLFLFYSLCLFLFTLSAKQ